MLVCTARNLPQTMISNIILSVTSFVSQSLPYLAPPPREPPHSAILLSDGSSYFAVPEVLKKISWTSY